VFDDHGAGHLTAGISHQVFQQAKFFGGELNPPAGAFGAMFHPVEVKIFHHQHRLRGQVAAAQQGTDTR